MPLHRCISLAYALEPIMLWRRRHAGSMTRRRDRVIRGGCPARGHDSSSTQRLSCWPMRASSCPRSLIFLLAACGGRHRLMMRGISFLNLRWRRGQPSDGWYGCGTRLQRLSLCSSRPAGRGRRTALKSARMQRQRSSRRQRVTRPRMVRMVCVCTLPAFAAVALASPLMAMTMEASLVRVRRFAFVLTSLRRSAAKWLVRVTFRAAVIMVTLSLLGIYRVRGQGSFSFKLM